MTRRFSQRQWNDLRVLNGLWWFQPDHHRPPVAGPWATLLEALAWPELESRRRAVRDRSTPVPRRYDFTRPTGATLHLPEVTTAAYTIPSNGLRQQRLGTILDQVGTKHWSFYVGNNRQPYATYVAEGHIKLLRTNAPPLLILEDDADVNLYRAWLTPPRQAETIMLGGSTHGPHQAHWNAMRLKLRPRRRRAMSYLPIDENWFRPLSMWSSVAYLYLTRDAMQSMADALEANLRDTTRRKEHIDTVQAIYQSNHYVACLQDPIWYQNDGHNAWATLNYAVPSR